MKYAGFWKRFVAYILDWMILLLTIFFTLGFLLYLLHLIISCHRIVSMILFIPKMLMFLVPPLYFAILDSSEEQGTYGKRILSIKVTDLSGNRISFERALGRSLAMLLSFLTLGIGFLMAGFTKKKQSLHDIIAECLVVNRYL